MNNDCIFCAIAKGETDTRLLYEDNSVVVFADLYPKAPVHLLIVPKHHYAHLNDVPHQSHLLLGQMMSVAKAMAEEHGVAESGYRLVMNCGEHGGQEIGHIHLHLLGGEQL
jgi:histidine triad (HIT) family protein